MGDLHSALQVDEVGRRSAGGVEFVLLKLIHGKEDFQLTLHARPYTFSTAGVQVTDFLAELRFSRSPCSVE